MTCTRFCIKLMSLVYLCSLSALCLFTALPVFGLRYPNAYKYAAVANATYDNSNHTDLSSLTLIREISQLDGPDAAIYSDDNEIIFGFRGLENLKDAWNVVGGELIPLFETEIQGFDNVKVSSDFRARALIFEVMVVRYHEKYPNKKIAFSGHR